MFRPAGVVKFEADFGLRAKAPRDALKKRLNPLRRYPPFYVTFLASQAGQDTTSLFAHCPIPVALRAISTNYENLHRQPLLDIAYLCVFRKLTALGKIAVTAKLGVSPKSHCRREIRLPFQI
jgi:hypothetical protein